MRYNCRLTHNLKVVGSNPTPATKVTNQARAISAGFVVLASLTTRYWLVYQCEWVELDSGEFAAEGIKRSRAMLLFELIYSLRNFNAVHA